MLTIDGLTAFYDPVEVLHGVSMEVGDGEIVSLIGPNGAGKTSLLRAVSRTIRSEGRVFFDGKDISGLTPQNIVALGVVHCPEGRQLFPDMTVTDNLELGAFLRPGRAAIRRDLDRVLELFPVLAERHSQRAGTMSGGEQQMLAIGRALMSNPRILMLDEPSFGIAPIIVDRIFSVIRQLNREGLTALVVEQNVPLALEISERTYVLEGGRIALEGDSKMLADDEDVREAYLGM